MAPADVFLKDKDGNVLEFLSEAEEFNFPDGSKVFHPDLSGGKRIKGAGEAVLIDGEFEIITPQTGHHIPEEAIELSRGGDVDGAERIVKQFDEDMKTAFVEASERYDIRTVAQGAAFHDFEKLVDYVTIRPFRGIRGMTVEQISELGVEVRKFYIVSSQRNYLRLKSGGTITEDGIVYTWPNLPERAHIGSGIYSWNNLDSAKSYRKAIAKSNNIEEDNLKIIEVVFDEEDILKFDKLDIGSLSQDEIDDWLERHSEIFSDNPDDVIPHDKDFVTRPTNFGDENYFTIESFLKASIVN